MRQRAPRSGKTRTSTRRSVRQQRARQPPGLFFGGIWSAKSSRSRPRVDWHQSGHNVSSARSPRPGCSGSGRSQPGVLDIQINCHRDESAASGEEPSEVRLGGCARILVMAITLGAANTASGWIYPEHRDIAVLAVQGLDAEHRAEFDRLWQAARAGDPQRMCAMVADSEQGVTPTCIDWAALSGIAGDHSCSSAEMLETVRKSDWILVVADVAAQLKVDLARIPVTAPSEQAEPASTDHCRRPAAPRRRGESRTAPERAALGRHADAARRPAVRDARGCQPRPFPSSAP